MHVYAYFVPLYLMLHYLYIRGGGDGLQHILFSFLKICLSFTIYGVGVSSYITNLYDKQAGKYLK